MWGLRTVVEGVRRRGRREGRGRKRIMREGRGLGVEKTEKIMKRFPFCAKIFHIYYQI